VPLFAAAQELMPALAQHFVLSRRVSLPVQDLLPLQVATREISSLTPSPVKVKEKTKKRENSHHGTFTPRRLRFYSLRSSPLPRDLAPNRRTRGRRLALPAATHMDPSLLLLSPVTTRVDAATGPVDVCVGVGGWTQRRRQQ
jgi:hypothetical protein